MDGVARTLLDIGILKVVENGECHDPQTADPARGETSGQSQPKNSMRVLTQDSEQGVCQTHRYNPELDSYDREDHICHICAENLKRRELEAHKQAFQTMQVGKRFHDCQWRDYEPVCEQAKQNRDFLQNFAQNFDKALEKGTSGILMGTPGTGKNMLAALVCKTLAAAGYKALHTKTRKLIRRLREAATRQSGELESEVFSKLTEPDLLVIDEVGVQSGSEYEIDSLTEIIDDRWEIKKPVLLLTNLDQAQMETLLGERIMERFYDGDSFQLEFNWPSYRRRNLKNNC